MQLKAATFDDLDDLDVVTVTMTAREMALLYGIVGGIAPKKITDASNIEWGNLFADLADDLGSIGCRFYDDGWPVPSIGRVLVRTTTEEP